MSLQSRVEKWCEDKIRIGERSVTDFIESIQTNGFEYAFTWSQGKVDEVARMNVAKFVVEVMTKMKDNGEFRLEAFIAYRADQCLRKARYPERSTSITSNLMATAMVAAWAEFCSEFTPHP